MFKRLLVSVSFVIIFAALTWQLAKMQVGDIRPALLPPTQNIIDSTQSQEVGDPVDLPLKLPAELKIGIFARGIRDARDIAFSPDGTLLVSTPSEGKVIAITDKDNDGRADAKFDVVTGLDRPHGITFYNGKLFVAETRKVHRYSWDTATFRSKREKTLFELPEPGRHFTRSLAFDNKGNLFVSIGSTCDVCEETDARIGIMVSDQDGNHPRLYARGLRNAPFIIVNKQTNKVWGTEMGRDFLGDKLPPDEINILEDGKNYGWPLCYGNKVHDTKYDKKQYMRNPCEDTVAPVYEIGAHQAPLGLTFIQSSQFPNDWQGDLLVAYHGSWNSSKAVGYKIVRLDVDGDTIKGEHEFITGFLKGSSALGRPVDLEFDKEGSLYFSDDKGSYIYKVSKR